MKTEKIPNHFGLEIRRHRRAIDMKTETLAGLAGVAKSTISKIESETVQTISLIVLQKIARVLNVELEKLVISGKTKKTGGKQAG